MLLFRSTENPSLRKMSWIIQKVNFLFKKKIWKEVELFKDKTSLSFLFLEHKNSFLFFSNKKKQNSKCSWSLVYMRLTGNLFSENRVIFSKTSYIETFMNIEYIFKKNKKKKILFFECWLDSASLQAWNLKLKL